MRQGFKAYKDDNATPGESVVLADGEELRHQDIGGQVVELFRMSATRIVDQRAETTNVAGESLVGPLLNRECGGTSGESQSLHDGLHDVWNLEADW